MILVHDTVSSDDERKAEIEASGLFDLFEKIKYIQEMRNNPSQYLKTIKSVLAFDSILDGLDNKTIKEMDSKIIEFINNHVGYINGLSKFSLYITKKYDKFKYR